MSNSRRPAAIRNALPDKFTACRNFYARLKEEGVDVEKAGTSDNGGVEIEYTAVEGSTDDQASEIRKIAAFFCGAQTHGEIGDLQVTAYDHQGGKATWYVKPEWVKKINSGEWTDQDFVDAVGDSIEEYAGDESQ